MIILYGIERYGAIIKSEEFDRVTEHFAFRNGRKTALRSEWCRYYASREEAVEKMEDMLIRELDASRKALDRSADALKQFRLREGIDPK